MRVAVLSPITWRTPPTKYGPWEQVASTIAEGLADRGIDITLFATGDSITQGKLESVCKTPLGEDKSKNPKVWECLHISYLMEKANEFDIIHNHFDFLPLTYSGLISTPMITTIHGFSSHQILPVYKKYNKTAAYVSISDSDRHDDLTYLSTIYHGLNPEDFPFVKDKEGYLLYFGRIHPDKGTHLAIEIALKSSLPLKIAGLIQDEAYFNSHVKPYIDGEKVIYAGNANPVIRNKLLGSARALLHPIGFEEPFGLSVIEAMMTGTPVIAFKRGSMPELIVDGKTGYLVPDVPGAVSAVKKLGSISTQCCHDHAVRHFSQIRMIDEYIAAYKKVLAKKK
ncbi:glycosyltransferase family 4 protein [Fulvivirga sp. M361]|uniref:glycosyltransferase family 4 protein n=1 Tax=Fulvivirga sp. M361 TaxID=2594266 RepID=UPI00117AEAD0|nr:glycosyltransferase family 4 protein [Fulvivirga sp. M361]TRX49072.1 glycosyltransferase family 4 protein [Fulvivirga sp. M361]